MLNCDTLKRKTIEDIKETQRTIDKLNSGQFTFGGMLKSDSEKKTLAV